MDISKKGSSIHLEQSPYYNLHDMLCGDFTPVDLSDYEIKQICFDCLVEADCSYGLLCITDMFAYISEMELAKEAYKKSDALLIELTENSYLTKFNKIIYA